MGLGQALMYMGGGALAGAGKGMTERAQNDIEQQRQLVLEQVRSRYAQENATHTSMLSREAEAEKQAAAAKAAEADDKRDHVYKIDEIITKAKVDDKNDAASKSRDAGIVSLRYSLGLTNAKQIAEFTDNLKANNVKTVQQDAQGNWFGVRENGTSYALGQTGQLRASGSSADVPLTRGGANAPLVRAPAPAPAARPAPKPAVASPNTRVIQYDNKGNRIP